MGRPPFSLSAGGRRGADGAGAVPALGALPPGVPGGPGGRGGPGRCDGAEGGLGPQEGWAGRTVRAAVERAGLGQGAGPEGVVRGGCGLGLGGQGLRRSEGDAATGINRRSPGRSGEWAGPRWVGGAVLGGRGLDGPERGGARVELERASSSGNLVRLGLG